MNSEGHRANILNPDAHKMGVGYYSDNSSEWGRQWDSDLHQSNLF